MYPAADSTAAMTMASAASAEGAPDTAGGTPYAASGNSSQAVFGIGAYNSTRFSKPP